VEYIHFEKNLRTIHQSNRKAIKSLILLEEKHSGNFNSRKCADGTERTIAEKKKILHLQQSKQVQSQ
jgi:hypothetical protein